MNPQWKREPQEKVTSPSFKVFKQMVRYHLTRNNPEKISVLGGKLGLKTLEFFLAIMIL